MPKHRRGAAAAAGLAVLALSGCWLQTGFDAGHTRFNHYELDLTADNVADLAPSWSTDLLDQAQEPMVNDGKVYLLTSAQQADRVRVAARAHEVADGTLAWERTLLDRPGGGSSWQVPVTFVGDELWGGYAFIGPRPEGGYPVRLDPATGDVLGREPADLPGTPFVDGGSVVAAVDPVPLQGWSLFVADETTGRRIWSADFPWQTTGPGVGTPTVADGQLFVTEGSVLHAFPLDGCGAPTCTPTWSLDLGGTATLAAVAAAGQDEVFVAGPNALVAVDRATGAVAWRGPAGSTGRLAVTSAFVYVADGSTLRAFPVGGCGTAQCSPAWTASLGATGYGAPTVAGGVVYVGEQAAVEAFPAAGCGAPTCGRLARVTVDGRVTDLAVAEGRLLVVSAPGGAQRLTVFAP